MCLTTCEKFILWLTFKQNHGISYENVNNIHIDFVLDTYIRDPKCKSSKMSKLASNSFTYLIYVKKKIYEVMEGIYNTLYLHKFLHRESEKINFRDQFCIISKYIYKCLIFF